MKKRFYVGNLDVENETYDDLNKLMKKEKRILNNAIEKILADYFVLKKSIEKLDDETFEKLNNLYKQEKLLAKKQYPENDMIGYEKETSRT